MFSFRSIFLHPDSHSVAFTKILSELNLANRQFKKKSYRWNSGGEKSKSSFRRLAKA
jgi:hypothetical protein